MKKRNSHTTIYTKQHKQVVSRLRKAREEMGLRQIDAAQKMKKPIWYIQKCESGQRKIDIVEILNFANLYEKPVDYFFEGL